MELLEYQAKALFREIGIPVLPSQPIEHPQDLRNLQIPYPIVLKSQVRVGGRGKVGGVRFVENTIDAVAAAQTMLHLPIAGECPAILLAEAKYAANQEFYLAVVLDRSVRRPVLLGSQQGGLDLELALDKVQAVVVEDVFSPFYARRLALKMGLTGALIESVSRIIEKMYRLMWQKDLDLVEINPLGVNEHGVMALDGKITANDYAVARHSDLLHLLESSPDPFGRSRLSVTQDGTLGALCSGTGLTLATLDLLSQAQGAIAQVLNIGSESQELCPPLDFCQRLQRGLTHLLTLPSLKVILVNLMSEVTDSGAIASVLAETLQKYSANHPSFGVVPSKSPKLVVRWIGPGASWIGPGADAVREKLSTLNIFLREHLDDAIVQAIALSDPPILDTPDPEVIVIAP